MFLDPAKQNGSQDVEKENPETTKGAQKLVRLYMHVDVTNVLSS